MQTILYKFLLNLKRWCNDQLNQESDLHEGSMFRVFIIYISGIFDVLGILVIRRIKSERNVIVAWKEDGLIQQERSICG